MLSDYLSKNGISNMEELIGREVFLILPRQGIKNYAIRRIQYGKQRKWMMCLPENYRVSELGESIFFTKEEAEKYQIQQLYKYSKKQRDRVIEKKIKERNTELEELYRLLKKYPTPELRYLIKDSCQLCSHRDEDSTYYEIPVYLCRVCNEHNMFDYDFDKLRELFGE